MLLIINTVLGIWVLGIAVGLIMEFATPRHRFDTLRHRLAVRMGMKNVKKG